MKKRWIFFVLLGFLAFGNSSFGQIVINNALGTDPRLDYRTLTRYGPWDDRNYKLTLEDLEVLAKNESELKLAIPAFFRVELRRHMPKMLRTGPSQYPRSAPEIFREMYGGFLINGVITNTISDLENGKTFETETTTFVPTTRATVNQEIKINTAPDRAETAISHNPVDPVKVIAGANGGGGQEMYYSADGGLTWTVASALSGNTCCDPTVAWSSDGTIAYTSTLGDCGFSGCGIWFYRSTDDGQTWGNRIDLTTSGSDKEYIHVDHSPSSPYQDYVYLTWHNSNVMQFARSRDKGMTFDPTLSFGSSPRGIGSDITTDTSGNIYYIWPSFIANAIYVKKSTDGGTSFGPDISISPTNGSFDWPIPAMDTRNVFIYAAVACDQSGGPYNDSIYACWNDTTGPESGDPGQNHSRVVFAYSRDAGASWTTTIPHPTDDMDAVDRFNPWMDVDPYGFIHVMFYSTIRDATRIKTDVFYSTSTDGGQTFSTPERVTSEQSEKINDYFEYGDYNGMSVAFDQVLPVWTDNRASDSAEPINAYTADVVNEFANPTFILSVNTTQIASCVDNILEVQVDVNPVLGFSDNVTLSLSGLPSGVTENFTPNPVVPGNFSTLTLTIDAATTPGTYPLLVTGSAGSVSDKDQALNLLIQDGVSSAPTLLLPLDGELRAGFTNIDFEWGDVVGAQEYHLQISDNASFSTTLVDITTPNTMHKASGFVKGTTYYWHVSTVNTCGEGAFSSTFSFVADSEVVLLVDQDDDGPDVRPSFEAALTSLGIQYKVYDASSVHPDATIMSNHQIVIWFSGVRWSGPSLADLQEIDTYINAGGKLFLSSQDFLFGVGDNPVPALATSIFGIHSAISDLGGYTSLMGQPGSIFEDRTPYVLDFGILADYSDILTPTVDAVTAFEGENGNGAALQTAQTIFFGFPFPALTTAEGNSQQAQKEVMEAILYYFGADISCPKTSLNVNANSMIDYNQDFQLTASPTGGIPGYTYSWTPTDCLSDPTIPNPIAYLGYPRSYRVTVTDQNSCSVEAEIKVYSPKNALFPDWRDINSPLDANANSIVEILDFISEINGCLP